MTPTPYAVQPQNDKLNRYRIICVNEAHCPGVGKQVVAENIRGKDTAEFIVTASNVYDELVAALQKARIETHQLYISVVASHQQRALEKILDTLDAAIAKDRGEA